MAQHAKVTEVQELDSQALENKMTALMSELPAIFQKVAKAELQLEALKEKETQENARRTAEQVQAEKKAAALGKALKTLVPTDSNRKALENRKIEFLFPAATPRSANEPLMNACLDVARKTYSMVQNAGLTSQVTARAWGLTTEAQAVALNEADSHKKLRAGGSDFGPVADYIRDEVSAKNAPAKNYVIVTTGNLAGNVEEMALKFAFLKLNPAATVDFVVCNNGERSKIDVLVEKLKKDLPYGQINLTKNVPLERLSSTLTGTVRERVGGRAYGLLPPPPTFTSQKSPSQKKPVATAIQGARDKRPPGKIRKFLFGPTGRA